MRGKPYPPIDHCRHLGKIIRQGQRTVCGQVGRPFDVHACAVHGECSLRRVCRNCRDCSHCAQYEPRVDGASAETSKD